MLGKLKYTQGNTNHKTKPVISGTKLTLLLGTVLAATPSAYAGEDAGMTSSVQTLGELHETIISVTSTEGTQWDAISDGAYKIALEAQTDVDKLGIVYTAALYPGHCITTDCATHPPLWSASPDQPISGIKLDVDFTSENMLTQTTAEGSSPAAWLGEQLIAECNARMGEDGPTLDVTVPVKLPFSLVLSSEKMGSLLQTNSAEFLLNCTAFDGELASLDEETTVDVASTGVVWTGDSGAGFDEPIAEEDFPVAEDDPIGFPGEEDEDGFGEIDLGHFFPFPIPFPPEDPEVPEIPEEPVDPVVNPGLGELPDDLAPNDDGLGPDPGPDPEPPILVLPIPPQPPVDPKVNPNLGELPDGLTVGISPSGSGGKKNAGKKAIHDAQKKKQEAKKKKKAKQKQAILDAQRKKQEAKKKRKAEKKALRDALNKKAKKKKAKRTNSKPDEKKKVVVKRTNGKKVVKVKRTNGKKKNAKRVTVTTIKVAPAPKKKKRGLKVAKKAKKKQNNR